MPFREHPRRMCGFYEDCADGLSRSIAMFHSAFSYMSVYKVFHIVQLTSKSCHTVFFFNNWMGKKYKFYPVDAEFTISVITILINH